MLREIKKLCTPAMVYFFDKYIYPFNDDFFKP